jgi:hypothetical protein
MISIVHLNLLFTTEDSIKVSWKISAAIYRPRYSIYKHWALCAENEETCIIYEVTGEHGTFQRSVLRFTIHL